MNETLMNILRDVADAFIKRGGHAASTVSTKMYVGQQEYFIVHRTDKPAADATLALQEQVVKLIEAGMTVVPEWPEGMEQPQGFEPKPTPQQRPPSQRQSNARGSSSGTQDYRGFAIFPVDYFKSAITENGKRYCKVFGGAFKKYGVKAWPETMNTVSKNWEQWNIGAEKRPPHQMFAAMNKDAKYKKVNFIAGSVDELKAMIDNALGEASAPASQSAPPPPPPPPPAADDIPF